MEHKDLLIILGLFRSGTSCLAGCLHRLGISMGSEFSLPNEINRKGTFEDQALARLCRSAFIEPGMERALPAESLMTELEYYVNSRREITNTYYGLKHPTICMMYEEMSVLFPHARYLVINRPFDESLKSLSALQWGFDQENLRFLLQQRDRFLHSEVLDVTTIEFEFLLEQPETCLQGIVQRLDLREPPSEQQWHEAIEFVDDTLPKWNKPASASS